ncbi:MAG: hypothetical protein ACLTE2_07235 [Eubacteriales bacterium]
MQVVGSADTGTSGGGSTAESSLKRKAYFKWFCIYGNCLPQLWVKVFHEQNPGVTVEKSGTGSGDASKAGNLPAPALIGDLSRELKRQ